MKSYMKLLCEINVFKTLYANLRLLPINQAAKCPILIGQHTHLDISREARIEIKGKVRLGMIRFSMGGSPDLSYYQSQKSYLGVLGTGKIIFHGPAQFAPHTSILVANSIAEFGERYCSNTGCKISCTEGIYFGDDCLLGGNVYVRDSDGHSVYSVDAQSGIKVKHSNKKAVHIGDHVWIANECSILKGVTIPDNCIVAYGSICTCSVEKNNAIIAGCPAKVIKEHIEWEI